jgi:hypothetical protein
MLLAMLLVVGLFDMSLLAVVDIFCTSRLVLTSSLSVNIDIIALREECLPFEWDTFFAALIAAGPGPVTSGATASAGGSSYSPPTSSVTTRGAH